MPVPSSLADLSTTAASNSPAGSDAIGTSLDDYLRTTQALLKQSLSRGTDIASASSITIPTNGNYCVVTGTTTIASIADSWNGRLVTLKFSGALTLTNSAALILPGGENIITSAGDSIQLVNESTGVWRCVSVNRGYGNGFVSVKDFGALGDGTTDDTAEIQAAIDAVNAAGGGSVYFPPGTYRVTAALTLYSNIALVGAGKASALHLVNTARSGLLKATGTQPSPLSRITVRDMRLYGDATFSGGTPSVVNGGGIDFQFTDDCSIDRLLVSGFSDGGIAILNGNYNCVSNCRVRYTAQGISFNANAISVYGNVMDGNICTDTGTHNGLHLEGSFGDGLGDGNVIGTAITGNTLYATRECGINIELAPNTSCCGNTVLNSGYGATAVNMGIKLFGSLESTVVGNTIKDSDGYGIVVGANSGNSTVSGNTTISNTGGSLLVTDSGAAATYNVTVGNNNLTEGDLVTSGNVSFINRTRGFKFSNVAVSDAATLDWYEENTFTPYAVGSGTAGTGTYTVQTGVFTRIGNTVFFQIYIGWSGHTGTGDLHIAGLPYSANGTLVRTITCWTNGLAIPAGTILQASIPQGGVSYINISAYADTTGNISAVAIDTSVAGLALSGFYQV